MSGMVLIGLVLAAGIWLVASSVHRSRTTNFVERIAPQLKSQQIQTSLLNELNQNQLGILEGYIELFRPFCGNFIGVFQQSTINSQRLEMRLARSGTSLTLTGFRAEQILWAVLGLLGSVVLLSAGVVKGNLSVPGALVLCILCSVCGFFARDWWLSESIKKRESLMLAEFPALAELMALSVTAGESAVGALERVCRSSTGVLSQEFGNILSQMRTGDGLVTALQDFSQRTEVPQLARFVDGIVVAIERGTPLSEVLRAQAQDVRDSAKRDLMEAAGKKEIAMMAPIIFCILPLTVIFALFPGLSIINFNF